jgi:tetratricopeptide (TPR) repeat protein
LRRRDAADREYAEAARLRPHDERVAAEAHRNRGYLHMESGRLDEAAAEFTRALASDPSDYDLWRFVAIGQCASGDVDSYRQTCTAMFDRFGRAGPDRRALLTVVLTCTLQSDALPDMTRLVPAAREAAQWWIDSDRCLVGLHYRLGRYDDALDSLRRHSEFAAPLPNVRFFGAMAHHRLGHRDEARRMLADAVAGMEGGDEASALNAQVSGSDPRDMGEKVSEHLLRREAEALILGRTGGATSP